MAEAVAGPTVKTHNKGKPLKRNENQIVISVTGGWKKLHNEELHNLYSSPNTIRMIKSRRMRWAGHVARAGEKRNAYRILVGDPEGKRPLGRPRLRRVNNIKGNIRETGWDGMNWIDLAQDRDQWRALVNTLIDLVLKMLGSS
jgi:hypothetical protein